MSKAFLSYLNILNIYSLPPRPRTSPQYSWPSEAEINSLAALVANRQVTEGEIKIDGLKWQGGHVGDKLPYIDMFKTDLANQKL